MKNGNDTFIWQAEDWPIWRYDLRTLAQPLADVSLAQGLLLGRMTDVGMAVGAFRTQTACARCAPSHRIYCV